jgi:nitroreductase
MTITFNNIIKIRRPKPKYKIIKEIADRWSPRYYSDKKIPLNHLKIIIEAARWTPSGHNRQPWYFYYVTKGTKFYKILFSTLNKYNQSWAKTAPIFILACAITNDKEGNNPFAFYDLGASVISLILQAQSLGYYARQIALFDKEKVKKIFKLEKNFEPFIIIALGKIGDYKTSPKEIIQMELDPRPRKTDLFKKLSL